MARPTCSKCSAIIRWIRTKAGKSMPCDPEKITAWVIDEPLPGRARVVLTDYDGVTRSGYMASPIMPGSHEIEGYVSHYATCPHAEKFRK